MAVSDEQDGQEISGRRRDSTGQNRYPPNSLEPGNGWGFGRMRKSRKQAAKVVAPLRRDSLFWKTGSPASRSESYLPEHPPRSDSPPNLVLNNQLRLPHSNATTSLPAGAQAAYSHAVGSPSSPAGPSAYARYLSFISDVGPEEETSPSSQTRPQSPSSTLTRSASLSETTTSGESSWPLLAAARRRRGSLSLQRFRRDSTTTTPRKLQKRRAGSTSTIIHTRPTIHVVPDMSDGDTEIGKEDHIPCTQDAVGMDDEQWALARNSSTSTTTSSMIAPSTEESTVLTPPYPVIDGDGNTHHRWSSIDILNASRSSTASYSSGDDETLPDKTMVEERPTFDLRQMLLDDSAPASHLAPLRPSLLHSYASNDSTIVPAPASPVEVSEPAPATHAEAHQTETPSPVFSPAVDFTASPIDSASLSTASPTASPFSTVTAISTSRSHRRNHGHFRSRASSVSAISINRASEYSITSIGEVGVASQGSMAPATTVHLPSPAVQHDLDGSSMLRPGMQRSKSEAGQHLSRALTPFLSREPPKSSPSLPPRSSALPDKAKPTPRLSLPLLDTSFDRVEPEAKTPTDTLSPNRTSSLGRLWRRLSSGRRKTKSSSSHAYSREGEVALPKSVSCVDVSTREAVEIIESPKSTFQLPLDEIIPEIPTPAPRTTSLIGLHPRPPASSISFASVWQSTSLDGHGRKAIGPRKSSLSTPPSLTVSDYSHGSCFPNGFTGSHLPRAAEAPSTRTIIEGVTLANTPDLVDERREQGPEAIDGELPPRPAGRRPEHRRARFSMDDATPEATIAERRKYRQTLVDIQDDVVFHQVLQDLARLEKQDNKGKEEAAETDELEDPAKDEWKASKGEIRAWFVTRELVQGERRHGRLLARGVATVQAAAESRRDEVPPLPTHLNNPHPSHSAVSLQQLPSKTSFLSRRQTNSRSTNSVPLPRPSPPSSSAYLSPLTINISPRFRTRNLPAAPPSPTTSPLELLLERLPRLLALSLTLSSRFEDDPSPYGVAEAFVKMEYDLVKEIGLWAGEVGNIVAVGMGEMLDSSTSGARGRSRRSISGDAVTDDESQEDRLGFADIIIMPIQRAARYKLLFQEMLTITDTSTRSYVIVNEALSSAERLAAECDRRQVFDLQAIRRQHAPSAKKGKKRPRSVGVPSIGNGHPKEKSWAAGLRVVEV